MGILKVVVNTTETERVLYTELPDNYRSFLDFLQDNIKSDSEFLLYWIDTENDKVEVNNENAYNMFCRLSASKKVFVNDKKKSPSKQNVHFNNNLNAEKKEKSNHREKENKHHSHKEETPSKTVHYGVQCDNCDVLPIVGFRYKCLQCSDYDLCMTCENKCIHSSHKMIRIPDKLFKRGTYGWRFCNPLFDNLAQKGETQFTAESGSRCQTGENHHHRRRRCHREAGRPGFMSNFVQMMSDMAEGEKPKNNSTCNNGKESDNTNSNNQECFIDPELIKTGVEVLSNFGEMFSKMIDPLNITVEVDVDEPNGGAETNLNDDSAHTKEKNQDIKDDKNNASNISAEQNFQPQDKELFAKASASASSSSSTGTQKQINPDMEWTIIDDSNDTNKSLNTNITREIPTTSSTASIPSTGQNEAPKISFSELNKVLENHIREEIVKGEKENQEERNRKIKADIVYHKEPHINNAIIAMIAMGFSNEGQWLTHLLESVNGDISQALDLLKPAK